MFARERGYANDMLMLAARGINGGTPVGRSEKGRKGREEEAIGRVRRRSAKEVAMHAGAPRSRFITVIMNAYDDADDENDDKNDDDGNDMVVEVTLRSMARDTRDKLSNKFRVRFV